jgi:hypothetical protein
VRDARKQVLGLLLSGLEVIFHQHVAADGLHRQQRTQTNVITLHTTNFFGFGARTARAGAPVEQAVRVVSA